MVEHSTLTPEESRGRKALALQKKQEETIEDWAKDKIKDTYIKINEIHSSCEFSKNWIKK